ncbi:ThuA domain-containing protein [Antiquaquibacter oligotrophicus]|uniref:ThuA domain-containing protein n=1 Tax=Antiquaquibacter oligotrophicus TaxID=2880260 RepID=UPI002AC90406|nr:ThuA domain-containing protein [Antiquaquibacter oligotrophicus]UDF12006.1 ThuA domain-containing protein [Antiquaquibacter oligotrophicus]
MSLAVPLSLSASAAPAEAAVDFRVLVFSKTAGFRHGSIETGNAAIEALGEANNFEVEVSEDATLFDAVNADGLATYDAIVFNSTTGDFFTPEQQETFENYIRNGGGFAGIHAASDAEYDWPWWNQLVGAYFNGHPVDQTATIKINDRVNPSTEHLTGDSWQRLDEWYNFRNFQTDKVHVLLSLVESSYTGGTNGVEHPISWCQEIEGGRSWYTGMGHTNASFSEQNFLQHILGGIKIAAGVVPSGCSASQSENYEKVVLDENTDNPMALDIVQAGDESGTVFFIERNGRVQRLEAGSHAKSTALTLSVTQGNEDGLLGIVLDPDFDENGWGYFYYSPNTVSQQDGPHNRISRFTYNFATKVFDPASEVAVLKVPTQRNTCCHAGGDMLFDNDGNLILATGDNTNPFESDGYAPIDERAGRQDYDAQRTSGNTNDLRGKIIRITPTDEGGYTIPSGNLFDENADTEGKTRPEIYAMGFRNPFRIGVDPKTNNYLVGEYGPDAGAPSATRGPAGTVEWNIVDEPGNYGWPYVVGVKPYRDYNFATSASGPAFSLTGPTNNSPNNTGLTTLPPVIAPELWMENGLNPTNVPEIGGSGAPMGGPAYDFDPDLESDIKWPEYWDGRALFGEWNQGKMYSFQLNRDAPGDVGSRVVDIDRTMPGIFDPSLPVDQRWNRSMDFEFGPDGALYIIDWGSEFGGSTGDSGVYRIDYIQGSPSPIARAGSDISNGPTAPLTVQFNSDGTRHPLAKDFTIEWDFGDGSPTSTVEDPIHTYMSIGTFQATLTVTDEEGKVAVATVPIIVGNAMPEVTITFPQSGGVFEWGDQIAYEVTVNDPDASGPIDCSRVRVLPALGHDSHNHDFGEQFGCQGSFQTARDAGHGLEANLFWVVNVSYVDDGGLAGTPLTGFAQTVLNPSLMQAEYFDETGRVNGTGGADDGVRVETTSDSAGGGQNLGFIEVGDWFSFEPFNLQGLDSVSMRLAKGFPGAGNFDVRWNSPTGPTIASVPFGPSGDGSQWQVYSDFEADFIEDLPQGTGTIYFVLTEGGANVNWIEYIGDGLPSNERPVIDFEVDTTSGEAPLTVNATVSATDPDAQEGDGPVTFQWNSGTGSGFVPGDASESFVYDTAGQYQLTVRATDARGAYTEESRVITVTDALSGMCFAGRSDGFDGTTLDTARWNSIVRPNQNLVVDDGVLTIPAARSDIHGGGGNTPNIVLQDAPDGSWSATAKINFPARTQWQQSGIVLYENDDNYMKLVMISMSADGNAANRVFQFLKEDDATPVEQNSPNLGAEFPDDYFVRLVSDGTTMTAWYSTDGENYTQVGNGFALSGIENPRIGLLTLGSTSSQTESLPIIDAKYDWFYITPDDTIPAADPNDEFDGTALNSCRWSVVREDPAGYRVQNGALQIDTTANDIYGGEQGVPNFILQPQPGDDWVVETRLDGSDFDRQYHQGGIILYTDDDNYVKLDLVSTNQGGSPVARNLEMRSEIGGVVQEPQPSASAPSNGIVYLRLEKAGTTFTAYSSPDGVTWTPFTQQVSNTAVANARVGLYALGNATQGQVSATAYFDYFRLVGQEPVDETAPTVSGSASGRTVTLTAQDAGSGVASIEYQLPGESAWTTYSAPFAVPGTAEVIVSIRATDVAGNVSTVGTVTVAATENPNPDVTVDRIAGANRYEVAVNISQNAYPETAPVVYVASGANYPDALSAGPAAAHEGGPLLLVQPNAIPAVVSAEIQRLSPDKIVVVGGTASVTADAFYSLSLLADESVRIAGANRYEASRNVAEYAFGSAEFAYLATGEKFPDALSAGGAAGVKDAPVILVQGSATDLDAATGALLEALGTTETRVLGGEASVSAGVFDDIAAITTATRLGGSDRYEAARNINADAFDTAERAFIATGLNFPDALAGSAWAASLGAPLYVAPGTCVTAGVLSDLDSLGVTHVTLLGGEASLTPAVFSLTPCA